jgi:hypothetical protein
LWSKLEVLIEDLAAACIKVNNPLLPCFRSLTPKRVKVYTLEKVLKLKKDAVSQISFIDEAYKVWSGTTLNSAEFHIHTLYKLLENKPSLIFWTSLAKALERQSRESAKSGGHS